MSSKKVPSKKVQLMWSEAARAFLCMLPMLVASGLGKVSFCVTLGQGGFFFSSLYLPSKIRSRFIMGLILGVLGLGVYLIGGNVAQHPWVAVVFIFFTSLMLAFLAGWKMGGPLTLTLVMIFTAGLNARTPERVATNFLLFALVLSWCTIISLLPFWKPIEAPPVDTTLTDIDRAEQGVRMGIATSIALGVSFIFGYTKLGWAPSAAGSVVRYDNDLSKKRALGRGLGTLGGALLGTIGLVVTHNVKYLVYFALLFAVINGLIKKTKIGALPIFYTATILLLYGANDITESRMLTIDRVVYNLIGIAIALAVVIYPFPGLMKWIRSKPKIVN
jgi:hypothetical protein